MADIINMPKLGFDMAEGTLVRWVRKIGEDIKKGDVLAEIETDKATVEVESSAGGVVRKLLVDEGAIVPINDPIAIVGTAEEKIDDLVSQESKQVQPDKQPAAVAHQESAQPQPPASISEPVQDNAPADIVKASPLAKKIARERDIDLSHLKGSGPGGRIVRRDIEAALSQTTKTGLPPVGVPLPQAARSDETINLSKLRQAIARRMTDSKTSVPHFYVSHEFSMDALMDLRSQANNLLPENEKLSVNDFIVKAVALALLDFPNLNASFQGSTVQRHGQVNVGIAVSVEGGLLTIVCRSANLKSLRQISAEVKTMAGRVRDGKVKPEDIEGSTFSVSNLGMYDVENFAAIINPPEAAILAVGSARQVPVVDHAEDGSSQLGIGWRMKATVSVDHRVSDGVEAAKFMQALSGYLEQPLKLLI
jgi:pyruvate dehydrogenase E2 component (dihydrolipoamide acetyltransferase)